MQIIDSILHTDMKLHFKGVNNLKSSIDSGSFDPLKQSDLVCRHIVHLADVTNPMKAFAVALKWTSGLYQENFAQGDIEREN